MGVYLVTWELNREKPNYQDARARFIARIQRYDFVKDPGLDSVVFISSNNTANQVSEDLRIALDDNDRLFVTRLISGNYQGWLSESTWSWINARL